jgi:hypothetical protein
MYLLHYYQFKAINLTIIKKTDYTVLKLELSPCQFNFLSSNFKFLNLKSIFATLKFDTKCVFHTIG